MHRVKIQKKTKGDFDPNSELIQAVIDPHLLYGSGRKMPRAKPKEIQSWIQKLRQADSILSKMSTFLHLNENDVRTARKVLMETAHALLDLGAAPGRSVNPGLGHYAYHLDNMVKLYFGKHQPELVLEGLKKMGIHGTLVDAGQGTVEQWVKNIVKRHRRFLTDAHRREIASFRNHRREIRRRVADPHPRTLRSYFPSLPISNGSGFWPDELASHDPKKCPMCCERRKRARVQRPEGTALKLSDPERRGTLDEYSREQFFSLLNVKLTNRLKVKLQERKITNERYDRERYPYSSDIHNRLDKATTIEEARTIVDSVDDYVDSICSTEINKG